MKNEIDSKLVLKKYRILTTEPRLATSAVEALQVAATLREPIAMKVVSSQIVHKAAAGGVRLRVKPAEVEQAFEEILRDCGAAHPGAVLDGVMLEEMIRGDVELFLGARVDADYGPVVLLGVGGGNVERGPQPAIALAPLDGEQADRLVMELVGQLGPGRLPAAAIETLKSYLLAVGGSDGMLFREAVTELDINPIIVSGERCVAVDAVVHQSPGQDGAASFNGRGLQSALDERRSRLSGMSALFDPVGVAFVGASTSPNKLGHRAIKNIVDFGFKGNLYPIHPTAPEIYGQPAYKTISDIPGPVDRALIAVGVGQVAGTLEECAKRGVKVAQVLTAGFDEWAPRDDAESAALLGGIGGVLKKTDLRMVGPNCVGAFSSRSRLAMGSPRYCPSGPGRITFISQSGTFAGDVIRRAQVQGVPVGQVLSCGNCSDLDLLDYLLFCESDPLTELTVFYIESLRDPGLFFRAARAARKPIAVLKGGTTEQGLVAASSHTAALSNDRVLWRAATEQAGILQVDSMDDLMDALLIWTAHGSLSGDRLGLFGSGGGVSVVASDAAARVGMVIPRLEAGTAKALQRFGVPGTSVENPIDIPVWGLRENDRFIADEVVNLLKRDSNIDAIIVFIEMGWMMDFVDDEAAGLRDLIDICDSVARSERKGPRIALALRSGGDRLQDDFVREQRVKRLADGIAVFPSTSRAVRANAMLRTMSRKFSQRAASAGDGMPARQACTSDKRGGIS